eukprot:TRINITY_DN13151_c0_g1_i1.p1 TRINITY_DN13151_c0_g1~~TRINITY_DN13151_c0_g1_i1.p1  ORF type:complete len:347 (+),score=78.63 TRINITY_DN13151_c0_g1_i1:301-1341(+)
MAATPPNNISIEANASLDLLRSLLPSHPFIISEEDVIKLLQNDALFADMPAGYEDDEDDARLTKYVKRLLDLLTFIAQPFASPVLSNFFVGAAILAASGKIYLGTNVEFEAQPMSQSIHAEQFAFANVVGSGEKGVIALSVTHSPCGHCRQFMAELGTDAFGKIVIRVDKRGEYRGRDLLPDNFGPPDLGIPYCLLGHHDHNKKLVLVGDCSSSSSASASSSSPSSSKAPPSPEDRQRLVDAAMKAITCSYSPYALSHSVVACLTSDGTIATGCYIENAAHNPSLPPLQGASVALMSAGKTWEDVTSAVLLERKGAMISQAPFFRVVTEHCYQNAYTWVVHCTPEL